MAPGNADDNLYSTAAKKSFSPTKLREGDDLSELRDAVVARTKDFDPKDHEDVGQQSEWQGEPMGFFELAGRQAECIDYCFLWLAIIFSILFGCALPVTFLIFA